MNKLKKKGKNYAEAERANDYLLISNLFSFT